MRKAAEIDYRLIGDDLQAVIVTLDPGEAVTAEAGAMMSVEDCVRPITTFDPNDAGGGMLGKLTMGARCVMSGDSFMMTVFINEANAHRDVAFPSPFPGKIQPVNVLDRGGTIIAQRDSFLCGARGLDVSVALQRKIGAGFFGGEGFVLQRISGDGLAFLNACVDQVASCCRRCHSRGLPTASSPVAPAGRTGGGAKGTIGSMGAIFGDQ